MLIADPGLPTGHLPPALQRELKRLLSRPNGDRLVHLVVVRLDPVLHDAADRGRELPAVAEEHLNGMLVLEARRELSAAAAELRGRLPVDEVEPGFACPRRRIEIVELRVDGE